MTYRTRFQAGLTMMAGLFLLAVLFALVLYVLTPDTPARRGPILLASFIAILLGSLLGILFLLRWLLRPYHQLIGEAQRVSVTDQLVKSQDEVEFVLETFQSVVTQLQEQRKELERLSAEARERANSAENCLQTGTVYRRSEIQTVSPEGRMRRLGATIAPIELQQEGGPRGALCLLTDITEVTELREQVALKNNLESLGEMSAGWPMSSRMRSQRCRHGGTLTAANSPEGGAVFTIKFATDNTDKIRI